MFRVFLELFNFALRNVDDPAVFAKPQSVIRRGHHSFDYLEARSFCCNHWLETFSVKIIQASGPANPDIGTSALNGFHISSPNTVLSSKNMNCISIDLYDGGIRRTKPNDPIRSHGCV